MLRRVFFLFLFLGLSGIAVVYLCDCLIRISSRERIHQTVQTAPNRKVALLLGCSQTISSGRPNLYFIRRIEAAAHAFHSGVCENIIVSGDNGRKGYDEPSDMKEALVECGVPPSRIYCDYAGFRTLDSVVRAKEIFGQENLLIISQQFHLERAVAIAQRNGINAVGLVAKDVSSWGGFRTRVREKLARVRTVLDLYLLGTEPKFLGPAVRLGIDPVPGGV